MGHMRMWMCMSMLCTYVVGDEIIEQELHDGEPIDAAQLAHASRLEHARVAILAVVVCGWWPEASRAGMAQGRGGMARCALVAQHGAPRLEAGARALGTPRHAEPSSHRCVVGRIDSARRRLRVRWAHAEELPRHRSQSRANHIGGTGSLGLIGAHWGSWGGLRGRIGFNPSEAAPAPSRYRRAGCQERPHLRGGRRRRCRLAASPRTAKPLPRGRTASDNTRRGGMRRCGTPSKGASRRQPRRRRAPLHPADAPSAS